MPSLAMTRSDNRWVNHSQEAMGCRRHCITALTNSRPSAADGELPALADHTIAGYARTNFVMEQFGNPEVNVPASGLAEHGHRQEKDAKPDTVVNERIRARWQNNVNEYISVVLFGEVDTTGPGGQGPGQRRKQGADGGEPRDEARVHGASRSRRPPWRCASARSRSATAAPSPPSS